MLKLVIFDLDNTLYDYDYYNVIAEQALYKELQECFGLTLKEAETILYKAKKVVKAQLGNVASCHNRLLYMQVLCEQLKVKPALYAEKLDGIYWDSFLGDAKLYDYTLPVLKYVREKGLKIGLLTDLTAHIQYRKLSVFEIGEYFDYIVTSEEAGEEKPSEKMFELILRKSGVKPEEALMIGDSLSKDIEGAQKYCIEAIHVIKDMDLLSAIKEYI